MSSTLLRTSSTQFWTEEPTVVVPPTAHPHNRSIIKHTAINVQGTESKPKGIDALPINALAPHFTSPQRTTTSSMAAPPTKEVSDEKGRREKQTYRRILAAIFWCFFTLGLNDGSTGPLLPVYQEYYHVRIATLAGTRSSHSWI